MLPQGSRGEIHREEGNEEMVVHKGGKGGLLFKEDGEVKGLGKWGTV